MAVNLICEAIMNEEQHTDQSCARLAPPLFSNIYTMLQNLCDGIKSGKWKKQHVHDPRNGKSCSQKCYCSSFNEIRLYDFQEVPHYLQENKWILSGYRANLSVKMCIKSLFYWSNETVNMWSHLIGCVGLVFFLLYDLTVVIPQTQQNGILGYIVPTASILCYQVCMLFSFLYHMLNAHSEKVASRWLSLDLLGISIALIGIYLPGLYYGFTCHDMWRNAYVGAMAVFSVLVVGVQVRHDFRRREFRCKRLLLYTGLSVFGILPSLHWVMLHGGIFHPIVLYFLKKVVTMYCLAGAAAFFYFTRLPERLLPGKFDFFGNSHNLWHFLTAACFYYWHYAGVELVEFMVKVDCFAVRRIGL